MWDDYYGKQANPYGVRGFTLILHALEEHLAVISPHGTAEQLKELEDLIETTREALETESG